MSKVSFVLASTGHGPLIVNRNDRVIVPSLSTDTPGSERGYGVGFQLLETGVFDPNEVQRGIDLLRLKRQYRGDGVVAVDVGANIGAMTVPWARLMEGWGFVHAFECQERIFYALCGNIALNNLSNANAYRNIVGLNIESPVSMAVPNYDRSGSFGSVSVYSCDCEDVGQELTKLETVATTYLDYEFDSRIDLVKVDVEGMEEEVLDGGATMIDRERPILIVEHLKSDRAALRSWMEYHYYVVFDERYDLIGVHQLDPCLNHVKGAS